MPPAGGRPRRGGAVEDVSGQHLHVRQRLLAGVAPGSRQQPGIGLQTHHPPRCPDPDAQGTQDPRGTTPQIDARRPRRQADLIQHRLRLQFPQRGQQTEHFGVKTPRFFISDALYAPPPPPTAADLRISPLNFAAGVSRPWPGMRKNTHPSAQGDALTPRLRRPLRGLPPKGEGEIRRSNLRGGKAPTPPGIGARRGCRGLLRCCVGVQGAGPLPAGGKVKVKPPSPACGRGG